MNSRKTQPITTGLGDSGVDHGLVSTPVRDSANTSSSIREIAEVRLPNPDARRPANDASKHGNAELFPSDSDQQSSFTRHSSISSSLSSLRVPPAVPPPSEPPDIEDKVPLSSSDKIGAKYTISSSPDNAHTDNTTLSNKAHRIVRPSESSSPRSLPRPGCGEVCNEDLRLPRERHQQERVARQHQTHQFEGSSAESSRLAHREITIISPTLSQSKPASSIGIEHPPSSARKLVVRIPAQPFTMTHSMKPSVGRGGAPASSVPSGPQNGNYQRPSCRPYNGRPYSLKPASRYSTPEWTTWQELSVRILGIPTTTTTRDLWRCFSRQGTVIGIELYENNKGQREGKASVRFSPPPAMAFWEHGKYSIPIAAEGTVNARLSLEARNRTFKHTSPIDKQKRYEEVMVMKADSLEFGMMLNPTTMANMCTVLPTDEKDIQFRLSLLHREITVEFALEIQDPRAGRGNSKAIPYGKDNRQETLRFRIPFSELEVIRCSEDEEGRPILLISLETPPKFFKKLDPGVTHDDKARYWGENDTWYRQTDIVYSYSLLQKSSLTLKKTRPIIDLGRWTTYRFVFQRSDVSNKPYSQIIEAVRDYNITSLPIGRLAILKALPTPIWEFLDKPLVTRKDLKTDLLQLNDGMSTRLAFEVRYQLEVCISNGYLNEYTMSSEFVTHLMTMQSGGARDILEYVANQGKLVMDPMSLFRIKIADGASLRAKIPHYCVYIRSVTITPTTVYFQTPVPETSNRVIRHYSHYADRFLRVRFTEEKTGGKIFATEKDTMNEVFTRVKRVLSNGIVIGDRRYEFLACGNSQFREHGAYFFAPLPHCPTEKIRNWMGMFKDIETVPLYLARLGQCFSTTRAIHGASTKLTEMKDIVRNGYNFSDGVGRISPLLAHVAASELGILQNLGEAPSVFQIRAGGCKGVLAVWPTPTQTEVCIRKSQYKFPAKHEGLEVIRWSQFACANLNQQLILILSDLGVPDEVFSQKLRLQLSTLERAMTDEKTALAVLQRDIDHNHMTLTIAGMILDGFQKTAEPFLTSLLQLWRAWSIKYLKEKARITIGGGALLLGCVDETAILRGHYNGTPTPPIDATTEEKAKMVPEVFVQLSKNAHGKPEVVLGPMLLARNPSLHPGDVRVVCGVDVPELHHLKDVVVLPQTGDRDVASMCSGGDLDGDDFLVIWDGDLIPREWNVKPMDYSRPPKLTHGREIGIDDLTNFFVAYMKNDTLSKIARAHLANADYMEEGVRDERCLKLAALHSMAVDYVKTGHPAQMPRELRAPKRPHFMGTHYGEENIYTSGKVLGQLYDQVERINFVPSFSAPFDNRILKAYEDEIDDGLLTSACEIKREYDAHMCRIMAQHEIKTEFEVWSTFVLEHSRIHNDFKFHEQIGQISAALKDQFRGLCYQRAGGKTFQKIAPYAAAMYKITAAEMTQAVRECHTTRMVGGQSKTLRRMNTADMPFMSFPWLFQDILGKIAKNSEFEAKGVDVKDGFEEGTAREALRSTIHAKRARGPVNLDAGRDLETAQRTTHVGDLLELFEDSHS